MASLAEARRFYAEELRHTAGIDSGALVRAFATVPRERFLGSGPWRVTGEARFRSLSVEDPRHLYHNVLVSIDPTRNLNNGSPSLWAALIDEVAPAPGERVFHLGAGTGYYSAILAGLVGPDGSLQACELRPELAARAVASLSLWPWATVESGDGTRIDPGPVDVIVINAGTTHPLPLWLERLAPGGRMLLPLTSGGFPAGGIGGVLRVERRGDAFAARFVSRVGIYPCLGARDPGCEKLLGEALAERPLAAFGVRSLRTRPHAREDACWLHSDGFCLSSQPVDG